MRFHNPYVLALLALACTRLVNCSYAEGETETSMEAKRDILTPSDLPADLPSPPVAERRETTRVYHGRKLVDPYSWLKDESYPKVDDEKILTYLKEENAYFEAVMKPYEKLTKTIFEELKGRLKENDSSVPWRKGDWLYQWRYEEGEQYRRWYRRSLKGGEEQLILDEPQLAAGLDFFRLGSLAVSDDAKLLAWSSDDDGSERFTMRFKNLETSTVLDESIENTIGNAVWAADNRTLFYLEVNDQWRPFRVKIHVIGSDPKEDRIVYEEEDGSFFVSVDRTQSNAYIVISTGDHVTNEVRLVPASEPNSEPRLISSRKTKREYFVEHRGDQLYIRTNDTHKNYRIATAPEGAPEPEHWKDLITGSHEHYLRGLVAFADFLVIRERIDGVDQIRIRRYDGTEHFVEFPEQAYAVGLGTNAEFDVDRVRLSYESMISPDTVYDYHINEKRLETLKVQEIPSGYEKSNYITERVMATARDGVKVPISIVYRKGFRKDGSQPMHLYGYGAYGHGMPPDFSTARLSLLDRGFAYAIAHIRGGDEMGYHWYEDGKLKFRTNTFNDFVDAGRFLAQEGYGSVGNISASGGSAGGELMGAVLNQAPALWRAVAAHVPFVDVLNTMLDDTLPLTPIEWPEWGNPIKEAEAYDTILSYSPYDNVEAKNYPPIFVTAGLNDPRVTYWEPAKWTAKLRATKTDDNLLLLKTNMGAGHGGKSGRYRRLHETAEEFTFLLMAFGQAASD